MDTDTDGCYQISVNYLLVCWIIAVLHINSLISHWSAKVIDIKYD